MPQYMLSVIHGDDDAVPPGTDLNELFTAVDAFNRALTEAKAMVFAAGLTPASSATVVDAVAGQPIVTDGPYLESREYLGGFWVIAADDLDGALRWDEQASTACRHSVEVRPLQDEPE